MAPTPRLGFDEGDEKGSRHRLGCCGSSLVLSLRTTKLGTTLGPNEEIGLQPVRGHAVIGSQRGSQTNVVLLQQSGPRNMDQIRTNSATRVVSDELPRLTKYAIIGAGIHGLSTALAPRTEAEGDRQGLGGRHSGCRQDGDRGRRLGHRLRRGPQQLLPARHARADGAFGRRVGERSPKITSYHPVGYMQISPEVHARAGRHDLRAAEGDRLRVGVRRGRGPTARNT